MQRDPRAPAGFTFVDLTAVIVIVVVLLALAAIVLPSLGGRRSGHGRQMQNNTQIRGIHQSLVMFAQGNRGYFPGIDGDGADLDLAVQKRFEILLQGNYFTPEYAVSPHEVKTPWITGPVLPEHYSYSMLQVPPPIDPEHPKRTPIPNRRQEWSETLNHEAVTVSDRNLGTTAAPYSIHTEPSSEPNWRGTVAYNDNHVAFESSHILPTKYGLADAISTDHLFESPGADDALLIHSGN